MRQCDRTELFLNSRVRFDVYPGPLYNRLMVLRVVIHEAEEGGFWDEVPALPGCVTQAETLFDLRIRAREAIEGYLGIGYEQPLVEGEAIMEIAV